MKSKHCHKHCWYFWVTQNFEQVNVRIFEFLVIWSEYVHIYDNVYFWFVSILPDEAGNHAFNKGGFTGPFQGQCIVPSCKNHPRTFCLSCTFASQVPLSNSRIYCIKHSTPINKATHRSSKTHTITKAEQQPWNWASSMHSKKATDVESSPCTVGRQIASILFRIERIFQIWQENLQKKIFSNICILVKIFNTHWKFYHCIKTLRIMSNRFWRLKR